MNPTAIPAYTSSPVQQTSYHKENKRAGFWKWLFAGIGCGVISLIACGLCAFITLYASRNIGSNDISDVTYTSRLLSGDGDETVAIININGVIQDFDGAESILSSSTASAESLLNMIDFAIEDQNATAILFRMNTPGGTLTGAETVCHKIKEIREQGVYTVSWIETESASGGYYIASCTDWIISRQEAITGSIGVVIQAIDTNAFLESIGFKVRVITNSEGTLKSGSDLYTEGSETEMIYREILDEGYNQFIDAVAEGRRGKASNLSRSQIGALADGRIYTGAQAEENGLIDELGYYTDAISCIIDRANLSDNAKIIQIEPQVSFYDSLAGATIHKLIPVDINVAQPGITLMAISTY